MKRKRSPYTIFISICIVLLIICYSAFVGVCTINGYLNKINRYNIEDETVAPADEDFEVDGGEDTVKAEDLELVDAEELDDEELLNVLLIGQDRHIGQTGRTRSDTLIVVSINMETHRVSMISFLRDLYVQIPDYTSNRINAAYVFGGYNLLKQVFLKNFGIHLDGYIEVDFANFISVIDTLGGVDIYLTDDEAEIVGGDVTQGINHLTGKQALTYARIRQLDSDFGRTGRQRAVLLSVFNGVKSLGLSEIMNLLDTCLPLLTTSFTNIEITTYAVKLIPYASEIKVSTFTVPAAGTYADETVRGMMVLVPDIHKINSALKNEYLPF